MIGLLTVLTVSVVLQCVNSQTLPANPCPNLFKYVQNSNGVVYGQLEFENDYSGYYRLTVNMSIAAYLLNNKNIQLELKTSANDILRARPLVYNIYFPIQNVLPKPTRIEFNQRVYCTGPPEELRPGTGITNMWATTYYGISLPSRPPRPNTVFDIEIQRVPEITLSTERPLFTLPSIPYVNRTFFFSPKPFTLPTSSSKLPWQGTFTLPTATTNSIFPWQTPFTATTVSKAPITTTSAPFTNPPHSVPISTIPTTGTSVAGWNPNEEQCGASPVIAQQLVVNGDDIVDGQFPWLVAILYNQNSDYKYRCTGSLVSNRHVITAGHCVRYNKILLSAIEDLLLVFGKRNIQSWANGALLRDVKNITVHPDYKQNKGDGDIAVIMVEKPIEFESDVKPICLWQQDENLDKVVSMTGTVIGWGRDESKKDITADAKKVTLPIVSQGDCLRSDPGFSSITSPKTFCAGNRNGIGPCYGDSGAGFAMNVNGKWTLRGVLSSALGDVGTCDLKNYLVFVDIAKVRVWISQVMA